MITQLDRVGLVVSDGDHSAKFYTECLGMELVSRRESTEFNPTVGNVFQVPGAIIRKLIRLSKGAFYLILFEIEPRGRPRALQANNPGSLTLALVSKNIEEDYRRLCAGSPELLTPPTLKGGRTVCYASDPDGVVTGFVENFGEGIDALASITVSDAEQSAAFFTNFGLTPLPELDEATAAEHKVIGMRLGPVAFQFDEYLHGKGTERVSPMNNVGAVQFDFFSDDVEADYKRLHEYGATVISPPVSTRRGVASTGFDPDGVMWELSSDDGIQPKTPEYYRNVYR